MMSNQLMVGGSLQINNINDLNNVGHMLAKCGYFADARDAAQASVKVMAGLELGIPAFASMTGISIIQGKPAIGANIMASMVKRSPKYNYKVKALTGEECILEFFENKESVGISSFNLKDARDADLSGGKNAHTWKKYARNMLFARAISNGIKWYCPDLFLGAPVYTPEELGAKVDEEGNIIEGEITPPPAPKAAVIKQKENTLEENCIVSLKWFDDKYFIEPAAILAFLKRESVAEMTEDDLDHLRGIGGLIKDGTIKPEDAFVIGFKQEEIEP